MSIQQSDNQDTDAVQAMQDWWSTDIIEMSPGSIRYRGYAIQDLIGRVSFPQMIWLMVRGELPDAGQARLLEAALVAGVDHGPQAPSIAIARMAATCGVGLNNAMASGLNVLGDVHGGAGEQAVEIYQQVHARVTNSMEMQQACEEVLAAFWSTGKKYVPGFGHRFHPLDPRAPRLLELVDEAREKGIVQGLYADIARCIEAVIRQQKGRQIPMNIDGATAVIYAELGFAPALARGLFCLSRSVGILAHSWEQMQEPTRNKGPIPRQYIWRYTGTPARSLEGEDA
ncbi:citryl-CoA lyase [Allopusillimonas ginsengisoli]|nr:citryl-CoA lyase [Allopusillimonas ginsengisoli]